VEWKLELVAVPVSDVDRAKAFYTERVGFVADHDFQVSETIRFVQLTPPGSACSIAIGTGLVETSPGSVQGLQLVVDDIEAARAELLGRRVEVGEAVLEYDRPRPPCRHVQQLSEPGMTRALKGRGGICTRVVRAGNIRVQDAIETE